MHSPHPSPSAEISIGKLLLILLVIPVTAALLAAVFYPERRANQLIEDSSHVSLWRYEQQRLAAQKPE